MYEMMSSVSCGVRIRFGIVAWDVLKERAEAELGDRRVIDHFEEGRCADVRVDELVVGNDMTCSADLARQLTSRYRITLQLLRCRGPGPEKGKRSEGGVGGASVAHSSSSETI